jgi:hypothetical protein
MGKCPLTFAITMISILVLAAIAIASDPFVGTWKLDLTKSKFPPGQHTVPKEETIVIRELGADQIEINITTMYAGSSPVSAKYKHPKKGGAFQLPKGFSAQATAVETLVDPGDMYITYLQNGKQVEVDHWVVNKDGKTVECTIRGTDAEGNPWEGQAFYDRQ